MTETAFQGWAILELMGHRRLAGHVTEATLAGGAFLRIDVISQGEEETTQFYSPSSVYALTPCTEEVARKVAERSWETPARMLALPAPPPQEHPYGLRECVCGHARIAHEDAHEETDALCLIAGCHCSGFDESDVSLNRDEELAF